MPSKKRYEKALAEGKCGNCLSRPVAFMRRRCEICMQRSREWNFKYYYNNLVMETKRNLAKKERYKKDGRCPGCSRKLIFEKTQRCQVCKEGGWSWS